jgi:SAM-dependent methyltransferase
MPSIAEAVRGLTAPDADAAAYLEFHRRRYEYLMLAVDRTLQGRGTAARILDVGLSYQTRLLREVYPEAALETLGFFDHRFGFAEAVRHTQFDLNRAAEESEWPDLEPFDLILLAEVLEHLYVPPKRVLRMFRQLLRPGGALLIQTPNPVSLARRLALLAGRSPFEIIRDDPYNPGHFCEYTVENLQYLAGETGLDVAEYSVTNYFGRRQPLYDLACAILPGRLGEGITMVLRRPAGHS